MHGVACRRQFRRHLHRCLPVRRRDRPVAVWKVASTPDDPSRGIAAGVAEGDRAGRRAAGAVGYFGHGTTVATNALIQHRGVRTGLITTDGFRDLLEIGRQKRPDLYDLQVDKPVPWCRDLRLEVPERVRHDGSVEMPLDEARCATRCARLRDAGVQAVAVCFLYGFVRNARGDCVAYSGGGISRSLRLRSRTRSRRNSANSSGCRPPW